MSGGLASTIKSWMEGRPRRHLRQGPSRTCAHAAAPVRCAPDGQHCTRCNGVHNVDTHGRRTFVTSLTWDTTEDDAPDTEEWQG